MDKTIKLWRLGDGKLLHTLTGHSESVWSVAFSLNGQTLASGSYDRTIKLWNLASGKLLANFAGHTKSVWSVAFSPNGQTLVIDTTPRYYRSSSNTGKMFNPTFDIKSWQI
jgi:WD40 repeat protein